MRVDVVTLFPELLQPFLALGMVGRAVSGGALQVRLKSPRDFGLGRHKSVDDTPYGGGSGMVMRVDCLVECLEALDSEAWPVDDGGSARRSAEPLPPYPRRRWGTRAPGPALPAGRALPPARRGGILARRDRVALVCGRYEGFDDRVRAFVDEEVSLGNFVLSGGEVAAMAVIDACARLLPGVLHNASSAEHESHSEALGGLLEYPQFTRPVEFRGARVPDVLQGGNHAAIDAWRRAEAERRTRERRPDLVDDGGSDEAVIHLALVHHPVLDRQGDVVTTAITNLDLHDLARSARTYGAGALFVVHPIEAQRLLAERVQQHWVEGSGRRRIPDRAAAMELLRVVPSLEDAYAALGGRAAIEVWTTAARARGPEVTAYAAARERLPQVEKPVLLLFGTGWGLAGELVAAAEVRLEPIRARAETGYNHLSVRAACAITLDRLLG